MAPRKKPAADKPVDTRPKYDPDQVSFTVGRNGYKIGRPTKYDPAFIELMYDYYDVDVQDLVMQGRADNGRPYAAYKVGSMPSTRGFARSIGTWHDVVIDWTKQHDEFKVAYARCMNHLEFLKGEIARAVDRPTGFIFDLKCNHGWRDNDQATPVAVSSGTKVVMEFVADKPPVAGQQNVEGGEGSGDE
ncbi:terminase small subunit [Pantoea phage vB_PagS_MED16]|nr:terminase small subunit [Pantoea phage vB_PagS_MED16]